MLYFPNQHSQLIQHINVLLEKASQVAITLLCAFGRGIDITFSNLNQLINARSIKFKVSKETCISKTKQTFSTLQTVMTNDLWARLSKEKLTYIFKDTEIWLSKYELKMDIPQPWETQYNFLLKMVAFQFLARNGNLHVVSHLLWF